jgi:hypothetical protein
MSEGEGREKRAQHWRERQEFLQQAREQQQRESEERQAAIDRSARQYADALHREQHEPLGLGALWKRWLTDTVHLAALVALLAIPGYMAYLLLVLIVSAVFGVDLPVWLPSD